MAIRLKRRNTAGTFNNVFFIVLLALCTFTITLKAQQTDTTYNTTQTLTLQQCIDYALQHQPALQQANINVSVTKLTNAINLAPWLPQFAANLNYTHYFQLSSTLVANPSGGPPVVEHFGVLNTAIPQLALNQAFFSPSLLYSATSARLMVTAARQVTDSTKIGIAASVSKAFYNLLLSLRQIDVLKTDTILFARNVEDAYHQYIGGIVDETDYEQAAITLNNARAQLKQARENVIPEYAMLKQLMGFKPSDQFDVSYDTAQMMKDIAIDTTQQLQYEKRIEYQQLMTARKLQKKLTLYNELSFLPTLGGFYDYNYELQNNNFPDMFSAAYPYNIAGISLSWPLSTGGSRIESIRRAKLEEKYLDWSEEALKSEIYTEYTTALANYNGNLYNMQELQDNVVKAKRVYGIVALQYRQGIVPYLNLVTAESNLITSEIGYLNALFTVLSSKIDLEKAMGLIQY